MFHRFEQQKKPKDDLNSESSQLLESEISECGSSSNRLRSSKEPTSSLQAIPSSSTESDHKNITKKIKLNEDKTGTGARLFWDDFSDEVFDSIIAEEQFYKKRPNYERSELVNTQEVIFDPDLSNRTSLSKIITSNKSANELISSASNFTVSTTSARSSSSHTSSNISNENMSQKEISKKKSFTQTSSSQAHTTEWLRNQLDKLNKECSLLKETISTKEGESKILRDKLHEAKLSIEKHKIEKEVEHKTLRSEYEQKIKCLEKDLRLAKTEKMIKTIQEKSHIGKFKDNVKVSTPEHPPSTSSCKSFRKFLSDKEKASKACSILSQKGSSVNMGPEKSYATVQSEKYSYTDVNTVKTDGQDKLGILSLSNAIPIEIERKNEHLGEELKSVIYPFIFTEAREEYSFIVLPAVDYYPFNILYRDWSEIPTTDDPKRVQKNLKRIWNIQLEQHEKMRSCQNSMKRSRYFTSLKELYSTLFEICRLPKWDHSYHVDFIIQHVTKMARELYIALRDPAVIVETTISLRENEVINHCLDKSELKKDFNPFSPNKWKQEFYVDLRRAVALIAVMCELDKSVAKNVLQKSGFLADKEYTKRYFERCQVPLTSGKWYDEDLFLSSPMQSVLSIIDSENLGNIHATDSFIKENYEVGEMTTLFHNLSIGQCNFWKKRLHEIEKEDLNESLFEYRSRKFSEKLNQQLDSIKTFPIHSKAENSSKFAFKLPDLCLDKSNYSSKEVHNFQSHIETKINDSWAAIIDDMRLSEEPIKSQPSDTKEQNQSVMATLMEKEELKWISKILPHLSSPCSESRSTCLAQKSSNNCITEMERKLLSSAFHNFLKMKTAFTGEENMCHCQKTNISNQHGLFVGSDQPKIKNKSTLKEDQIKRKQISTSSSPCVSLGSSTSSYSGYHPKLEGKSRFLRTKRDLAPFKKKQVDICEPLTLQESADIEDAVSKMYIVDAVSESRKKSDKPSMASDDLPQCNQNESITKEKESRHLEDCRVSEEKSVEVQLDSLKLEFLEVLLEIVRRIGLMRYTSNFNALLAVIIQLLQSCLKAEVPPALLRPKKICELTLEILYCRPSPIVLRSINYLLFQCMPITGFARLMCTNAHPRKFTFHNERISFKRGSCFLSTVCSLITFTINNDDWDIQFYLFRWLAYLFFVEKTTVEYLYDNQKTTSGRCKCVWTLNSTIMSILAKAAAHYYSCSIEKNMTSLLKYQLTEIIEHGIRMVSVIVEIDKFFSDVFFKHDSFILFLETVIFMNSGDKNLFDIELQEKDLKTIKLLLEDENIARNLKNRSRTKDKIEPEGAKLFSTFHTVWPREMLFSRESLETSKLYFDINDEV